MSYKSELGRTWWLKNPAFKAYMLREATVLPLVFSSCACWPASTRWARASRPGKAGLSLWGIPWC